MCDLMSVRTEASTVWVPKLQRIIHRPWACFGPLVLLHQNDAPRQARWCALGGTGR